MLCILLYFSDRLLLEYFCFLCFTSFLPPPPPGFCLAFSWVPPVYIALVASLSSFFTFFLCVLSVYLDLTSFLLICPGLFFFMYSHLVLWPILALSSWNRHDAWLGLYQETTQAFGSTRKSLLCSWSHLVKVRVLWDDAFICYIMQEVSIRGG